MRVRSVTAVGRMAVADRAAHDDLRIIGDEHPGFPEHFFELLIGLPVFEVLSQLPHFFEVDAVLAAGEHLHGSSHKGASYVLSDLSIFLSCLSGFQSLKSLVSCRISLRSMPSLPRESTCTGPAIRAPPTFSGQGEARPGESPRHMQASP